MSTPTKDQELAILDEAIKKLGNNSYLAPFLTEVRGEAEQSMRSDIYPEISLARATKAAKNITDYADNTAKNIRDKATAEAQQIISAARLEANRIRNSVIGNVQTALKALQT
jgi:cell division septum initiation protein DivIVA